MSQPDSKAHFVAEELPDELRRQSLALAEMHAAWATRQAALGVSFDPDPHPEGSDYNVHSYDLDAAGAEEDDYAAAAAEILGR